MMRISGRRDEMSQEVGGERLVKGGWLGESEGGPGRRWRTRTADLYRVKVAL
jgi:hypothetical protein